MSFLCTFGVGADKIRALDCRTAGTVTAVKTCWWLKVNTKPVRKSMADGARFPHIIHFIYHVDGFEQHGKYYVNWNYRCPQVGEKITVCYHPDTPDRFTVDL